MKVWTTHNGGHGYSLYAVAKAATHCYVYLFEPVATTREQASGHITEEQLLDASTEWPLGTLFFEDAQGYKITVSKCISVNHGVLKGGHTLLVAKLHDHPVVLDLGVEKYPDHSISDRRWCKNHLVKPIFKLIVHTDGESILDCDKVYYYDGAADHTILTNEPVEPVNIDNEDDIPVLPTCTVVEKENGDVNINVVYDNTIAANGDLHLSNRSGLCCSTIPVVNGLAVIPAAYIVGIPFADICYGYSKIGEL